MGKRHEWWELDIEIDPENPPMVCIEWNDAMTGKETWEDMEEVLSWRVPPIGTGLYLIQADAEQVTVIGSHSPQDEEVGDELVIPRGCIKAIWLLRKGRRLDKWART